MKVLGIAFSAREDGNCLKCVKYCLDKFKEDGFKTEVINAYELIITPCSHCRYECFANNQCPIEDDVDEIYKKCDESDILIFAIPTYGGHLSSLYFAFAERVPASLIRSQQYAEKLLKKVNFIIIGNLSASGEMAVHEALYDFANRDFWTELILICAREYDRWSLEGDLIEVPDVKKRLDRFVEMILKNLKNNRQQA